MRKITHIVLHCTAGPQNQPVEVIKNYWKNVLGWKSPGYHFIILADGTIVSVHPIELPSNGVAGHNSNSIHISYTGGVDSKFKAIDNRTDAQKQSQIKLLKELRIKFPYAKIVGHRDFPGVKKSCPSFDVKSWLDCVGIK